MSLWFETLWVDGRWAERVRVAIADDAETEIETGVDPRPEDERHAIGVPGLPNVHSHAFQRGMAGLAEHAGSRDDDFWSWRELMYRFAGRITPEDLLAIAAQAYAEMLETGFTRVGEFHYVHRLPDGTLSGAMAEAIAEAARETGIGLTLLPVFYAQGGFGGAAPGAAQRRFLTNVDGYAKLLEASRSAVATLPAAVVGVAPHSLRAVTPDQLRAILDLSHRWPVHIHIAEQQQEVSDCRAWSGRRPVEWLLDEMPVDQRWTLVHATHVTDAECAALARTGATVGLCPITEANLGDGIFPAARFLEAGGAFGIGSDSNVRIDAAEELRTLEYGQRLTAQRRNVLAGPETPATGARLFAAALRGGERSLGAMPDHADLVSLDPADPAFAHRRGDAILDSWIFAARAPIDCVWRNGVKVVQGGRHLHRDSIEARYRAALARLLA